MLHPACPAIARMSYYRSLESYGEYGACVTSPVWFAAASVLGAIAAAGMTIAGLTAARRHDPMRRRTRASVIVPAASYNPPAPPPRRRPPYRLSPSRSCCCSAPIR